eukprot:2490758-Rhodomonas_salina.1
MEPRSGVPVDDVIRCEAFLHDLCDEWVIEDLSEHAVVHSAIVSASFGKGSRSQPVNEKLCNFELISFKSGLDRRLE